MGALINTFCSNFDARNFLFTLFTFLMNNAIFVIHSILHSYAPVKTPTLRTFCRLSRLLRVLQLDKFETTSPLSSNSLKKSSPTQSPPFSSPQQSLWISISPIFFVLLIVGLGSFFPG